MSTRRRYVRVATLGTNLQILWILGCHFHFVRLHFKTKSWLFFWPFFPPDGHLYAVGGYDSSSHLATVEKYDPQVTLSPFHPSSFRWAWMNAGLTLLSQTEQRVDGHCQHAEPTQQRWGGRAGRHALCRRRQRRHQLPQLCGTIQPQDQHLGRGGPHEHTQVGALANVILFPEKYFWGLKRWVILVKV